MLDLFNTVAKSIVYPDLGPSIQSRTVVNVRQQLYNRIRHPDSSVEDAVESKWRERLKLNPKLYNGTKFRLASILPHATSPDREEGVENDTVGYLTWREFLPSKCLRGVTINLGLT